MLAPEILQLADGHWQLAELEPEHPARVAQQATLRRWLALQYQEQQALLRLLYKDQNRDPFISTFAVWQRGGEVISSAAWAEGIPVSSWLPRVDLVVLVRKGAEPLPVPWKLLEQVLGPLPIVERVPPPERYEVTGFPTPEEIQRMTPA